LQFLGVSVIRPHVSFLIFVALTTIVLVAVATDIAGGTTLTGHAWHATLTTWAISGLWAIVTWATDRVIRAIRAIPQAPDKSAVTVDDSTLANVLRIVPRP
jgi:hypothetical protein